MKADQAFKSTAGRPYKTFHMARRKQDPILHGNVGQHAPKNFLLDVRSIIWVIDLLIVDLDVGAKQMAWTSLGCSGCQKDSYIQRELICSSKIRGSFLCLYPSLLHSKGTSIHVDGPIPPFRKTAYESLCS